MSASVSARNVDVLSVEARNLPVIGHILGSDHANVFRTDLQNVENVDVKSEIRSELRAPKIEENECMEVDGLVKEGNPMEVTMLDLGKINNEMASVKGSSLSGFKSRQFSDNIVPFTKEEAFSLQELLNKDAFLSQLAQPSPGNKAKHKYALLFFVDNSDSNGLILFGKNVKMGEAYTIKGRCFQWCGAGPLSAFVAALSQQRKRRELRTIRLSVVCDGVNRMYTPPFCPDWWGDEPKPDDLDKWKSSQAEMVSASFRVQAEWTESAAQVQAYNSVDYQRAGAPFKLFQAPASHTNALVTVSPGWLDPRVKDLERSLFLRFIHRVYESHNNDQVQWPETSLNSSLSEELHDHLEKHVRECTTAQAVLDLAWEFLIRARSLNTLKLLFRTAFSVIQENNAHLLSNPAAGLSLWRQMDSVNLFLSMGEARIRRDIRVDWAMHQMPASKDLDSDQLEVTIEERLHTLLVHHLALQTFKLCSDHIKQTSVFAEVATNLVTTFQPYTFDTVGSAFTVFKLPMVYLNTNYYTVANIIEWNVHCDFGPRALSLHLSRDRQLPYNPSSVQFKKALDTDPLPEGSEAFWTYFVEHTPGSS